jgi:hypothetical protein
MFKHLLVILGIGLLLVSCSSLKPSGTEKNDPPEAPSNPYPENGAIDQDLDVHMTWSWNDPDEDTVTCDIYLGTETNPPLVDSNLVGGWYNPENLEYSHSYYWKIVADDGHGHQVTGPIWHFTTMAQRSFDVLASYTNSANGPYFDLSGNIQSNYLYVTNRHSSGTRDSSLILNIANPDNITAAGYVRGALFGNQMGPGYIYSVGKLDNVNKLRAYSLGDATNPNEEFSYEVAWIQDLVVSGDYVYLYMNGPTFGEPIGIYTFHNMVPIDTLATNYPTAWGKLRTYGQYLLLPEGLGLDIISITNPATPQIVASIPSPDDTRDAAITRTTMYVALYNDGVEIIDISNLPTIDSLGLIPSVNHSTDIVFVYQNFLYVADDNLLIAYETTIPSEPVEYARYETPARITSLNMLAALLVTYTDSASTSGILGLQIQQ